MGKMAVGYSVVDLAPLALGYYEGQEVYFIDPEASEHDVARVLTDMMGTGIVTVLSLAEVPAELLENVYVFINRIENMGSLGSQPDVFDFVPSEEIYTPLRATNLVARQATVEPRQLDSVEEIFTAVEAGELSIEQPGAVVNRPILMVAFACP